jgi:hypothetical protein
MIQAAFKSSAAYHAVGRGREPRSGQRTRQPGTRPEDFRSLQLEGTAITDHGIIRVSRSLGTQAAFRIIRVDH